MYRDRSMIRRFEGEFEERQAFVEGLIAGAQETAVTCPSRRCPDRQRPGTQADLVKQLDPSKATAEIAAQSRQRTEELDEAIHTARTGQTGRQGRVPHGGRVHRRRVVGPDG